MNKLETLIKSAEKTKKLEGILFNAILKAVEKFLKEKEFNYEYVRGYLTSTKLKIEVVVSENSCATFAETLIYDKPLSRYSIVSDELKELKPFEKELSDLINFEFEKEME